MGVKKNGTFAVRVDHRRELVKTIHQMSQKHSTWQVFEDFLALFALSISNAVDKTHWDERESQYMKIIGKYDKSEIDLFPQMFVHLIGELQRYAECPKDVLGMVFHDLELHNKYKGQFFTSQDICDMMGKMSIGKADKVIPKRGYLTVYEPCCGGGAMVLGFARAMRECKFDYQKQMVVTATDIDIKCVYMTYIQLSLYGIPAVVIHGNTLSMEEWSRWYTPVYLLNGWLWRQNCGNKSIRYPEDEIMKRASDPVYAAIRDAEALTVDTAPPTAAPDQPKTFDINLKESDSGQLKFDF